jgi:hypothetical protein
VGEGVRERANMAEIGDVLHTKVNISDRYPASLSHPLYESPVPGSVVFTQHAAVLPGRPGPTVGRTGGTVGGQVTTQSDQRALTGAVQHLEPHTTGRVNRENQSLKHSTGYCGRRDGGLLRLYAGTCGWGQTSSHGRLKLRLML